MNNKDSFAILILLIGIIIGNVGRGYFQTKKLLEIKKELVEIKLLIEKGN